MHDGLLRRNPQKFAHEMENSTFARISHSKYSSEAALYQPDAISATDIRSEKRDVGKL